MTCLTLIVSNGCVTKFEEMLAADAAKKSSIFFFFYNIIIYYVLFHYTFLFEKICIYRKKNIEREREKLEKREDDNLVGLILVLIFLRIYPLEEIKRYVYHKLKYKCKWFASLLGFE